MSHLPLLFGATGNITVSTVSITYTQTAGTYDVSLWTVVGAIAVYDIWGVVVTNIGATSHQFSRLKVIDGTTTTYFTNNTNLTSLLAGTVIYRPSQSSAAMTLMGPTVIVNNSATPGQIPHTRPFMVQSKQSPPTTTDIAEEFTTSGLTSGEILWSIAWEPIDPAATVT